MSDSNSPKRTADQSDQTAAQASFKRRRTALACNSCRTRKTRCNGERPSCVPCIELGLECIYENPANGNKGGQQYTYDDRLKAIEDTLRLLVDLREPAGQAPPPGYPAVNNNLHPAIIRNADGQRAARLHDDDPNGELDNEDAMDGMASITDPTDSRSRFYGPSSNIAFLRHLSAATSFTLRSIEGQVLAIDQQAHRPLISRMPSPATTPSVCSPLDRTSTVDALALPLDSQAIRLIDLFFNETGLLFPFIQHGYVVSTFNNAKARGFTGMRKSFLCLLNAIFAMAAHLDEDPETGPNDSEAFYQRANSLLNQIDPRMHSVETVQSLLLMIQYRQGTQKSDDTWVQLGKAVRIALQLGLHSSSASHGLSSVDVEIRKRVWYNCVILDRVLSMTFGRPQTISEEYVRLDLPLNRSLDSLAVSVPSQGKSDNPDTVCFFIATIKLYDVLNFILASIYDHNLGMETEISLPDILKHGLSVEQKLLRWQNSLPPELKRHPWAQDGHTPSATTFNTVFDKLSAIIHLRYLNVSLLHHRAILDRFLDSLNAAQQQQSVTDVQDPFFLDFARHSLKLSQDFSTEIIDVVWKMSHRSGALGAWWFSAYYTFNACLVLYGCILVHFSLSRQDQCQLNIASHASRQQKMHKMISSLNIGVKAIERVGKGTRTAKGILRTLIKIIQISTRLAQLHGKIDQFSTGINEFIDGNTSQTNSVGHSVAQSGQQTIDSHQLELWQDTSQLKGQWEIPDLRFWTAQSDFDIFADLGSLDSGLGNFMAA